MTGNKNESLNNTDNLKSQLSRLNQKLISYKVVDCQGISRGEVRDIYYDANNELNLLIKLGVIDNKISLRRLEHRDIFHIDLDKQLILSNLSQQQLENLPLYQPVTKHIKKALSETASYVDHQMNPTNNNNQQQFATSEVERIPLLEEKLQVTRCKQKVGEVVVRKQVETRIVKVPIRREKLIVERIGKNPERLTEVVIGEGKVSGFTYEELNDTDSIHITKSHFLDLQTAQKLLEAIAQLSSVANAKVRLEIVTNCSEHQIKHQNICDRF